MSFPFPVYILERGKEKELPKSGNYYVVTKKGIFLHKDTGLIGATVRVDGISFLGCIEPEAELRIPKLPAELTAQAIAFFFDAYLLHQTEAALLIHYSAERNDFRLFCPNQVVSQASVRYDSNDRISGYQLVGSIHSHGGMAAFHSGVDEHDEENFDGLHITVGKIDPESFGTVEICSCVVVNGNRFEKAPEEFLEGIRLLPEPPLPQKLFGKAVEYVEDMADLFLVDIEHPVRKAYLPRRTRINRMYEHASLTCDGGCDNFPLQKTWLEKLIPLRPRAAKQTPSTKTGEGE